MPVSWSEAKADSASFLAVVPAQEILDAIVGLRRAVGLETSVTPHVTVKAQPMLGAPDVWRPAVRKVTQATAPFRLALGDVRWFGEGIVYLSVGVEILGLHRALLEAVESVVDGDRFEYEGEGYVPHLTLGAEFAGETPRLLRQIGKDAARVPWPSFLVQEVVEFRREHREQRYLPIATYPFGSS
jgi:2'-5' RNA ligase